MSQTQQSVAKHQIVQKSSFKPLLSMMLFATALLVTMIMAKMAHPMPQKPNMRVKEDNGWIDTGKCSAPQFSEMTARVIACEVAQEREHLNDLLLSLRFSQSELRRATCAATWAKLDCFQKDAPLCLEGDHLKRKESDIVQVHLEILFNRTESLGRELMDECSFVQAKQAQVMMKLTDSDKCSYYDYEKSSIAMQKCREEVKKTRSHRLSFLRIDPEKQ